MKRNSRGMLSIIVIAILSLSIALPFITVSAISTPLLTPGGPYLVGDTIMVSDTAGGVSSGSVVEYYWDYVAGPNAVLLNTSLGQPDGGYETNVDVPETPSGWHYIWVKDVATGATVSSAALYIGSSIEADPTSGLGGDVVEVTAYGYNDSAEIWFGLFNQTAVGVLDWQSSANLTTSPGTAETDEYGSAIVDVTVPSGIVYGIYTINCTDGINWAFFNFTVGPSLVIAVDEGPSGYVISFTGRGYNNSDTIVEGEVFWDGWAIPIVGDTIDVDSDGDISGEVVAPTDTLAAHNLTVYDGIWSAYDMFTIDGTSVVEVTPTYGPPGTSVTVRGYNFTQIDGTEVDLTIGASTALGTVETNADGTFEATVTAPAIAFGSYPINGTDEYGLNGTDTYKIGILAMLFYPTSGDTGTNVTITGTGFSLGGMYNATLGDELVVENGGIDGSETLIDWFTVPNMDPGTHTLTVEDDLGNELSGIYTVTADASLTSDPTEAAVGYNVSFTGNGFIHWNETVLTWFVWNSTWGEEITNAVNFTGMDANVLVNGTGYFEGVWTVPEYLLLGNTYNINASAMVTTATGVDIMTWAETMLTVIEEEIDIHSNRGSYSLGDTVTFTIKATFAKFGSYVELRDPNGELIFLSTFIAADWMFIDPWQVVLIYNQVSDASMNPFMLPSDADIGTWTWAMYDIDDEIVANGTIEVLPTTAEQVDQRLQAVESGLSGLSDDIADVTSDLEDDINALSAEIGDVASDVDNLKDEIVSDLAGDIAAATDAANAAGDAVDDLEASVSDIADTANSAKTAADAAADAASDAATAAESASDAASGLTTLVYGAIGASLIAALAAIVSLMQISRRIAG